MKSNKLEFFIKHRVFVIVSFLLMAITVIAFSLVYTNGSSKAGSTSLNLSEKQLLLLNNYIYLENASKRGAIINNIDTLKANADSKTLCILTEIENDPVLSNLVIVDSINNEVKAICMVPENRTHIKNAEAVIIYQGTNTLDTSYLETLKVSSQSETNIQLVAGDFHEKCELNYNVTNVSGHSIGGNLAQYVTITNGYNVRNCVSFNGHGFTQEFIDTYKSNITMNAQKIVSISSYKEPLHTIQTSVASNEIFVNTPDELDPISSHNASVLYDKTHFDKYGMYKPEILTEEIAQTN
jgi:hypothetical protein